MPLERKKRPRKLPKPLALGRIGVTISFSGEISRISAARLNVHTFERRPNMQFPRIVAVAKGGRAVKSLVAWPLFTASVSRADFFRTKKRGLVASLCVEKS